MRVELIHTDRLLLIPFRDDDVDLMQVLDADPEVVRFLGHGKVKTWEESAASLAKILNDYETYGLGLFAVYEKDTQEFVGRAGLIPWIVEGTLLWEIGYSLQRASWGKGYASEAAYALAVWARSHLDVPEVLSFIQPENKNSIRVAEKIGMKLWKPIQLGEFKVSAYRLLFVQ